MSGSLMGKTGINVNTAALASGDSIAAYLTDAAGALLTSTLIGGKQRLDAIDVASHIDSSAYTTTADYLMSMGVVNNAGNWVPLTLDATGALPVSGVVTTSFTAEHNEDAAASNGDSGIFTLLVRQDTLAASTSTDGDYGAFKSNSLGELYVHDTSALAELVLIKGDTATIATNTGTTATNTGTTATNTGTISSTLTALSKAEDAAHVSGDQGIQFLGVRKDAQGSNVNADGDYAHAQMWSEGSLKVVDIANGSILQQQVSVTTTATALPTSALANRKSIMVQNAGAASFWIGSATVTTSGATAGIEVPKASFMEMEVGPAVTVYARAASGTVNANVLEMA